MALSLVEYCYWIVPKMTKRKGKKIKQSFTRAFWFRLRSRCQARRYSALQRKNNDLELLSKRLVEDEVKDNNWNLKTIEECMLNQMPLNPAFLRRPLLFRHQTGVDLVFLGVFSMYVLFHLLKKVIAYKKKHKKNPTRWKWINCEVFL